MRLISSRTTFFYKRIFPILWFGILGSTIVVALAKGEHPNELSFLFVPAGMIKSGPR